MSHHGYFSIFHSLKKRDPERGSHSDQLLLAFIRRANLDAFWSKVMPSKRHREERHAAWRPSVGYNREPTPDIPDSMASALVDWF